MERLMGKPVSVNGTSRTDAGVHALGQCCSFSGDFGIPTENILPALNNLLSEGKTISGTIPGAVKVLDCREVPLDFHARFNCKKKTYIYRISTAAPSPLLRNYCYFLQSGTRVDASAAEAVLDASAAEAVLDLSAMEEACQFIRGTHDFACFQAAGGTPRETTVRTIFDIGLEARGSSLDIRVTGDGFLYNMVRIIVGTLIEVGQGRRTPESVRDAIDVGDRTLSGHTAPACGLYLAKIYFDEDDMI